MAADGSHGRSAASGRHHVGGFAVSELPHAVSEDSTATGRHVPSEQSVTYRRGLANPHARQPGGGLAHAVSEDSTAAGRRVTVTSEQSVTYRRGLANPYARNPGGGGIPSSRFGDRSRRLSITRALSLGLGLRTGLDGATVAEDDVRVAVGSASPDELRRCTSGARWAALAGSSNWDLPPAGAAGGQEAKTGQAADGPPDKVEWVYTNLVRLVETYRHPNIVRSHAQRASFRSPHLIIAPRRLHPMHLSPSESIHPRCLCSCASPAEPPSRRPFPR